MKKPRKRTPEEQAAYDERTRRIEAWLAERGVPIGHDQASYDERTRQLEAAIERYDARLEARPESS
jgi:hypothetical protein